MLTKSVFSLLDLFYTQRRAIAIPFLNKSFVKHYKNAYSYSNANTKTSSPYPLFFWLSKRFTDKRAYLFFITDLYILLKLYIKCVTVYTIK